MQTKAQTVTEYMKESPAHHLDALTDFREICLQNLIGFTESMKFGAPSYSINGHTEVAWQSNKDEISLFIRDENILKNFKNANKAYDISKNNIYFKEPNIINFPLLASLLQEIAKSKQ